MELSFITTIACDNCSTNLHGMENGTKQFTYFSVTPLSAIANQPTSSISLLVAASKALSYLTLPGSTTFNFLAAFLALGHIFWKYLQHLVFPTLRPFFSPFSSPFILNKTEVRKQETRKRSLSYKERNTFLKSYLHHLWRVVRRKGREWHGSWGGEEPISFSEFNLGRGWYIR